MMYDLEKIMSEIEDDSIMEKIYKIESQIKALEKANKILIMCFDRQPIEKIKEVISCF